MIPVLTPEEMGGVDRAAPEPVDVLVARAGHYVARGVRTFLDGCYGKRVVVVAGPGNNGADGRTAAALLRRWGAAVTVLGATDLGPGAPLPAADVVVDAAFGTGLRRPYLPADPGATPVIAVDVPSGLSGTTGLFVTGDDGRAGGALRAERTVTFAALKPGLLQGNGPEVAGQVELAGIGLTPLARRVATRWLVTDADFRAVWPGRPRNAHKWQSAVAVVGGSPGMHGAPLLTTRAALRSGAGYVRLGVPGGAEAIPPGEHVAYGLPADGWADAAANMAERARALVVGPGLGGSAGPVAELLGRCPLPAVVDADGLGALGTLDAVAKVAAGRDEPIVLTPHEGEFARLAGAAPGPDRMASALDVARRSGAVVLLKGSPTVVAEPSGRMLVVNTGSPRLATAGTGDVLSGVIGAFLARGLPAPEAAAFAAHCHGRAAGLGPAEGLVASDLPVLVSRWMSEASTR